MTYTNNSNTSDIVKFDEAYLEDGYFDNTGNIRTKLIDEKAQEIVESFADKYSKSLIKYTQMRKFFQHARQAQRIYEALSYEDRQTEKAIVELKNRIIKLKEMASYAKGRGQIPDNFLEFISTNVKTIKKAKTSNIPAEIIKGFIPHFEAVVAYFKYTYRD